MTAAPAARAPLSAGTARNMLLVLTFVNLFNYVDRAVVPAVMESLKRDFGFSDKRLGALATAFLAVYALASPWFGKLGDTRARPRAIALGVAVWSVATVLGGFAVGFISLFVARAFVGVGEAAYGTIAPSVLADCFDKSRRGRVFAVFYAAIPIGSAIGYILAGAMDTHFGWRSAFFVAGAPGLLLAVALLRLPDPPRGARDVDTVGAPGAGGAHPVQGWRHYRDLLANLPYLMTVLGYAAYTFALGGLAVWMPPFLQRTYGLPSDKATLQIGVIVVATGLVGTFFGGWLGDYVLRYTKSAYLLVSGIAALLAAPCLYLALATQNHALYFTSLTVAELLIFLSTGPINSAIVNYVAPTERATAMALSILMIHVLGDVPAPWVIGAISDARIAAGATEGAALAHAVLIMPIAVVLCGVIWTGGAFLRASRGDTTPVTVPG